MYLFIYRSQGKNKKDEETVQKDLEIHAPFPHNHEDKINFIQNILHWQRGGNVFNGQRCFVLNFGYKESFPFPQIGLSLNSDHNLNVGTFGLKSPNKCSIVVIGGKYLEQVDEVMRMVDKITEDIAWMPYAVFLMAEKPGQDIQFNVSTRDNMSPAMVRPVL